MYPTHIHDKSNGKEGNKEVWQPRAEIYHLSLTFRVVIPEKLKNFAAKRNERRCNHRSGSCKKNKNKASSDELKVLT